MVRERRGGREAPRWACRWGCALVALLLLAAPAQASIVFDGRNLGATGAVYTGHNLNCVSVPALCPWATVQSDLQSNVGNKVTILSSPVRKAGRETARIDLVPNPLGTSERVQYRTQGTGAPATGKTLWFATSYQFRPGLALTPYTSLLDVGTKANTQCDSSVAAYGAAVPEIYFANPAAAGPVSPALTNWSLHVKVAGGVGSTNPFHCVVKNWTVRTGAIPTGQWIDFLERFTYSPVNGQALTELWWRVAPATLWTQLDLDPNTAGPAYTGPNLVRTANNDVGIDIHGGHYKGNQGDNTATGIDFAGLVAATTRAEAEAAAF